MRKRNRMVKIINISIICGAILLVLLIMFLIKNKNYSLNIKDAISIVSDVIVIDAEYYDNLLEVVNKGKFKKTTKQYGGLHKNLKIETKDNLYEFIIYDDTILYKKDNKTYYTDDKEYINKVSDAIRKYDYSIVKLDAVKIDYYKNKILFDTKLDIDLNGNNTILITANKDIKSIKLYQIFDDDSEILISNATNIISNDKLAYYININKFNNVRIEVVDDYKTNIYQSYIDEDKMKFIEVTKEPEIVLNPTNLEIIKGDEVVATVENFDGLVKWYTENEKIATVKNGKIRGVAVGKTRIYVITQNNEYIYMNVKVEEPKSSVITSINLVEESIIVGMYGTYKLSANIKPDTATNQKLQWSSSDNRIAKVDENGVVTGLSSGKAIISVRTNNGLVDTCEVRVEIIEVEDITISETKYELVVGETVDLDIEFTPANASMKDIKWASSDVFVATVDASGLVEAKGVGTTTITATSKNGKKETCVITVKEKEES